MSIITNTTLISNFAGVDQLELLSRLWKRLYLSEQVFAEIQAGLTQGYQFYANIEQLIVPFSKTGWLHLTGLNTTDEFRTFGQLLSHLHSGEASSLAIAYHRQWTFLSDDKAARKAGTSLNVPISGTIGVLLALVKHHHVSLTQADRILQQMIQLGYHAPVSSLNEILGD